MNNKIRFTFFLAFLLAKMFVACEEIPEENITQEPVEITKISSLNKHSHSLDSHRESINRSNLVLNYREYVEASGSKLGVNQVIYPRIKKMSNGRYIMFYQDGDISWNTYYAFSEDAKTWSGGKSLFVNYQVDVPWGVDTRCFATCDAVVLKNGDILAVASFRTNNGYYVHKEYDGLMLRRSKDNGKTWSQEQIVYQGSTWEPYLLQLPSGTVQIYFTDCNTTNGGCGVSILESIDNGESWSPEIGVPVNMSIRQISNYKDGAPIFTDQMPSTILLNDGKTIATIVESLNHQTNVFSISMAYTDLDSGWPSLEGSEVGPTERLLNMFDGAGGYIVQFPSGESIISYNANVENNSMFHMRMGDTQAKNFRDSYVPLPGVGWWGSMELNGSHTVLASMNRSDVYPRNIMVGKCILNHSVDANKVSVKVNGNNSEWHDVDHALFIGSKSQVQGSFRFLHDENNIYVCIDVLDEQISIADNISLQFDKIADSDVISSSAVKLEISHKGIQKEMSYRNNSWIISELNSLSAATIINDYHVDIKDRGYVIEVCIPKVALNLGVGENLIFHASMYDQQHGVDTFTNSSADDPTTWLLINLK